MAARDHLRDEETILASFPPFYATSSRILRCEVKDGGEEVSELPYHGIATVQIVREPNHKIAATGLGIAFGSILLYLAGFIIITLPFGIIFGIGMIVYGSRGKEAHYQFRGYTMSEADAIRWQIPFRGAAGFILAVGERTRRRINWT